MRYPSPLRPFSLCLVALATLALVRWLAVPPTLYAQTSPLATPWPTLVVTAAQPAIVPAWAICAWRVRSST